MADLNNNGIEDYFEGPSYEEELNRFMLGTGGFGAPSDKVYVPSFGQPAPGIVEALPPMPSIFGAEGSFMNSAPLMPTADEVSLGPNQGSVLSSDPGSLYPTPIADSVGQYSYVNPMMHPQSLNPSNPFIEIGRPDPVTNVDLMGQPLREQPSVEEIRQRSDADALGGDSILYGNLEEGRAGRQGFFDGLKRVFTDFSGEKMRQAERYAPRYVDPNPPIAFNPPPIFADTRNPFFQAPIDLFSTGDTTGDTTGATGGPIEPNPFTRNYTPESTFLRADGSIGQIFPNQRIGDAFPDNTDTPVVGSPFIPELQTYQGTDLPGGDGYQRAPEGMVPTIGPDGQMMFTTPEQANLIASSMSNGVNPYFIPQESTGSYSEAPTMSQIEQFNNVQQPGSPGSRLGNLADSTGSRFGNFVDSTKDFFREGAVPVLAGYDYLTDPRSPTMEAAFAERKAAFDNSNNVREIPQAIPQGQQTSIQRNFVDRMATGEPLTQDETAAALEFARFNDLNFNARTGFSPAPTVGSQQAMRSAPSAMNQQTMMTAQPRRPARSAYEQASLERQIAIGGTGVKEVDSALRQARLKAMDKRPGETQTERDTRIAKSRTEGADRGGQLSQADIRDLVKGSSSGAKVGDVARATEIRQRQALNQARNQARFQQAQPRQDKLSESTAMIDRMIKNGTLSPSKRTAAIQKLMNLGSVTGAGGSGGSVGAGIIGSAEFDRVASQLQEGGSLYNMGIRVDPSVVDPLTGAAQIYREKPGLEFGPPERLPVSPELMQQLLPYARSVRQGGTMTQDFTNMGMKVNQFAGSK